MKNESLARELMFPIHALLSTDHLSEDNILHFLPVALYACDSKGIITKYNQQAVKIWGKKPGPCDTDGLFYSQFKLLNSNGQIVPSHQTPVTQCLEDGLPRKDVELLLQGNDSACVYIKLDAVPITNEKNEQIGVICCFNDITEQKKTEKELEKKTNELRDYVENALIGLHWVDANGNIIWANRAEMNMLGYETDEYIGHHISEFHTSGEKINDILLRLNSNEELHQYEADLKCKDGQTKTVQITSNVYRQNGEFIHTRCFTTDITNQKKLFEQVKENEESQRRIFKKLPAAIYTCDKEGRISFYNEAAARLWGQEPEIGKDLWCGSWKILHANGTPMEPGNFAITRCLKEQMPVRGEEIIIVKPNGEKRYVMPHAEPVFDSHGKIKGAVSMLVDITEIKEAEKVLRESEARYRELASSFEKIIEAKTYDLLYKNEELKKSEERYHKMVDEVEDYAIILLDVNGFILNWNKGAEKIKGYKEKEIVGKSFQLFYLPEDRESGLPLKLIKHARENGKAIHEGWRLRSDGTKFWGSIVLTSLHNANNEHIGFSKVTRDLTERKLAEDRLKEYTLQLQFQNEQLEQFAYAASHDMKEPLRKIIFYTSLLVETTGSRLDEKEFEYLKRSVNAAKKMERLINDLLDYSRVAVDIHGSELIDLNEIIQEVIQSFSEVIEEQKASIQISELPRVHGIAFQFRQVFENLISNALKYQYPGRPAVINIVSTQVAGESVEGLMPGKIYHKIEVSDNGIGFDPEYCEKIFELFQRLSPLKYPGTGVGLAICKKIIQNHHGIIIATGMLGSGACFKIYLPV